jgi:HTH-type transcriptional regulator/antitoxin HigA
MIKRGWIEPSENRDVIEFRVLRYFNLENIDSELVFSHAARRNAEDELSSIQWAWLFRVRQLANALDVPAYTAKNLRVALGDLELLLVEPEEARHVPRILANAGVRFLVVEPIPSSKIEGVCFWLNEKSPVIALSMRFDRIDNFWFNLRHELEHVLNRDGRVMPIIDEPEQLSGSPDQEDAERLANAAAAEFCVSQPEMEDFVARLDPMYRTDRFIGFSRLMHRHPGIVAGQLQRKTCHWSLFRRFQVKVRHIVTEVTLTDGYGHTVPAEF